MGALDERAVLTFDRLDTGELVALHTVDGRTVAAIVHPERPSWLVPGVQIRPWSLAGDIDRTRRPRGTARTVSVAMGEAARALGRELDIAVAGVEVK